jgi:hypothetical protein
MIVATLDHYITYAWIGLFLVGIGWGALRICDLLAEGDDTGINKEWDEWAKPSVKPETKDDKKP